MYTLDPQENLTPWLPHFIWKHRSPQITPQHGEFWGSTGSPVNHPLLVHCALSLRSGAREYRRNGAKPFKRRQHPPFCKTYPQQTPESRIGALMDPEELYRSLVVTLGPHLWRLQLSLVCFVVVRNQLWKINKKHCAYVGSWGDGPLEGSSGHLAPAGGPEGSNWPPKLVRTQVWNFSKMATSFFFWWTNVCIWDALRALCFVTCFTIGEHFPVYVLQDSTHTTCWRFSAYFFVRDKCQLGQQWNTERDQNLGTWRSFSGCYPASKSSTNRGLLEPVILPIRELLTQ